MNECIYSFTNISHLPLAPSPEPRAVGHRSSGRYTLHLPPRATHPAGETSKRNHPRRSMQERGHRCQGSPEEAVDREALARGVIVPGLKEKVSYG